MPTHLVFLTLLLTHPLESLKCFWCTEFNDASGGFVEDQTACPSLRSDPSQWAKNSVKFYDIDVAGKNVVVVGRGTTLGRPMALLMTTKQAGANAATTVVHTGVPDIAKYTREADIVIAAVGRPGTITKDMVKPGAIVVSGGISWPV